MKDNKIDIMCKKIGDIIALVNSTGEGKVSADEIVKGLRQLQYDLETLRKCTLDNPDFKWNDSLSKPNNCSICGSEPRIDPFEGIYVCSNRKCANSDRELK